MWSLSSARARHAICSPNSKRTPSTWFCPNGAAQRDSRAPFRNHLLNQQSVSLVGRPRPGKPSFRFPEDLRLEPILLPSLDSDVRVGFDHLMDLAGIRPIILAEVDDMAMLRLLAREREGVTLVPPIVVRDELESGVLVEHCRIPQLTESFFAITQNRRFPNQLLSELLARYTGADPDPRWRARSDTASQDAMNEWRRDGRGKAYHSAPTNPRLRISGSICGSRPRKRRKASPASTVLPTLRMSSSSRLARSLS